MKRDSAFLSSCHSRESGKPPAWVPAPPLSRRTSFAGTTFVALDNHNSVPTASSNSSWVIWAVPNLSTTRLAARLASSAASRARGSGNKRHGQRGEDGITGARHVVNRPRQALDFLPGLIGSKRIIPSLPRVMRR